MGRLDRDAWLDAAAAQLVEGGVDSLAVDAVAERLGVTKGSFYWHFDRRRDLLDGVLSRWEQEGTSAIIAAVEGRSEDPAQRLRELGLRVFAGDTRADRLEPAVRAWASADPAAAVVVARVDAARLAYVRDLLVAAGVDRETAELRAELTYRALIGEWMWRSTGGPPLSPAGLEELLTLLLTR